MKISDLRNLAWLLYGQAGGFGELCLALVHEGGICTDDNDDALASAISSPKCMPHFGSLVCAAITEEGKLNQLVLFLTSLAQERNIDETALNTTSPISDPAWGLCCIEPTSEIDFDDPGGGLRFLAVAAHA